MITQPIACVRTLSALVIACAMAAFLAQPAVAQTASNLKCNGCVKSKQIKNNGVKSKDIKNGSLTALDLGDEAGVEFDNGPAGPPIDFVDLQLGIETVVRSVTVSAPKSGFVILNASGTFGFFGGGNVSCSLNTGSTLDAFDQQQAVALTDQAQSFGMTKGFVVPAGSTTFNLVCREAIEDVRVFNSKLTAIYAPTRY